MLFNPKNQTGQMCHGDQHWHARDKCFSCGHCSVSLVSKPFLPRNGAIFCSTLCMRKAASVEDNHNIEDSLPTSASQQTIDLFFKLGMSTITSSSINSTTSSRFSFSKCPNLSTLSDRKLQTGNIFTFQMIYFRIMLIIWPKICRKRRESDVE